MTTGEIIGIGLIVWLCFGILLVWVLSIKSTVLSLIHI